VGCMVVFRAVAALALCAACAIYGKARVPNSSSLLRALSLHDRIAQLIIVRGYGDYPPSDDAEYQRFLGWITKTRVGGFIVAGRIRNGEVIPAQPFEMAAFVNHMQRLARTPLLVGSDFERGASMRVAQTTPFPYLMAFGAAQDRNAIRELGAATAREARALGVNWAFAPDADVNNNPDNPIINTRSFGEEPHAVAENVAASTVAGLPCAVAQDRDPGRRSQIFARREVAAEDRSDAQRPKETVADSGGPYALGAFPGRQGITLALVDIQGAEYGVHPLPIQVVGIGEITLHGGRVRLENGD